MASLSKIQEQIEKLNARKAARVEALNAKSAKLNEKINKAVMKKNFANVEIAKLTAIIAEVDSELDALTGDDDDVNASESESVIA